MEQNTKQDQPFNVYCNGISISTSPFDFSFLLNNNSPKGDNFLGEVKMSPEHAKTFAKMLLDHVTQFEELFGEIPQLDKQRVEHLQKEGKIMVEEKV